MRSKPRSAILHILLISFVLFAGMVLFATSAAAQKPQDNAKEEAKKAIAEKAVAEKAATEEATLEKEIEAVLREIEKTQTDRDCDRLNTKIKLLADRDAALKSQVERHQRRIVEYDESIRSANYGIRVAIEHKDEDLRERWLEAKRGWLSSRDSFKQLIERKNLEIKKMQKGRDDLLKQLGVCESKRPPIETHLDCLKSKYPDVKRSFDKTDHAYDPKSGRNFGWDEDKQAWIDVKTLECICPAKCENPKPKPKPSPTPVSVATTGPIDRCLVGTWRSESLASEVGTAVAPALY